MRLLVIEDEPPLRDQLQRELGRAGFAVDTAADGRRGLSLALSNPYDLAVIDLGLPELDGVELIRRVRRRNRDFPILVLTARSNWRDKVEGLEAGADDYLVKPFHMPELRARINALLRRSGGHADPIIRFGPVEIDTAARVVRLDSREIELTSYEYNTLEYMIHRPGQVISRSEFNEHLYQQDLDRDSNVIEVFIGRLRKKLDPRGTLKPIETLRGHGYRFALKKTPS